MCIFAPYSKILTGVNFVHVNRALDHANIVLSIYMAICLNTSIIGQYACMALKL